MAIILRRLSHTLTTSYGKPLSSATRSLTAFRKQTFFSLSALSSKREYKAEKLLGYTQSQLYDVVANVNEYKLFVPYCTHSQILAASTNDSGMNYLTAELSVGFKGFEETYVSEVTCERPWYVQAIGTSDVLFRQLISTWRFIPHDILPTHCHLEYYLEFEFASPLHAQISGVFFDQISELMVSAFESRCGDVYGPPTSQLEYVE
ncbi:4717_t:CDS:2 [Paraglomus brasilianum]|uniref:4717_t:CDS:1 n=1 Tax=Paraglomus brasilianum TaxID=144538 RepID=A0A9N9CPT3_9GLOM|nr:4717_t:CDS:2 [Paraglomus brasilianum]